MCRNIKTLFNFDPPVAAEEVRAASVQFIRKISGFNKPSKANEAAFLAAVEDVAAVAARLLRSLETVAPPKNREEEAPKARARVAVRFGTCGTGTLVSTVCTVSYSLRNSRIISASDIVLCLCAASMTEFAVSAMNSFMHRTKKWNQSSGSCWPLSTKRWSD